jgi:SAM-dependent methyltransferase
VDDHSTVERVGLGSLNAILTETATLERDVLDRERAHALDRLLSRLASVQRYRIIRKYVRGLVVDAACGTGFGSWILSKCPAVRAVVGFDCDRGAVAHSRREFPECEFFTADFASVEFADALAGLMPDTIVSVETIEHLADPAVFLRVVRSSGAKRFVVTFPSFETVTFNPYHVRDWTLPEMNEAMDRKPTVAFVIDDAVQLAVYDL